ncbi:MAG: hypothetical protein OEW30_18850, partial [Acidimicrobiia bacterium]|nr:hypothetical protein [Acidimicrobiia bacterium]
DVAVHRAFRNLPDVVIVEPGHVTTYDVLWSDRMVFTTDTVSAVARPTTRFQVAADDFVKESTEGGEV